MIERAAPRAILLSCIEDVLIGEVAQLSGSPDIHGGATVLSGLSGSNCTTIRAAAGVPPWRKRR